MSFRPRNIFAPIGFGSYGFGDVEITDQVYHSGWTTFYRALALPNLAALNIEGSDFFNAFNNLRNHLEAWRDNGTTASQAEITSWTNWLNALMAEQSPAALHPDIAEVIRRFYQRYLNVTAVDAEGLDFWVGVVVNDGAAGYANAERGFRQSALDQGLFTEATLPAPEYFSLGNDVIDVVDVVDETGDGVDDTIDDTTIDDTTTDDTTVDDGIVGGIQDAIGSVFDRLEETTGVSKQYLQIGAVVVGIGALMYFGGEGKKRR